MADTKPHHLVDFASRYSGPSSFPTLNASVALYRAEELIRDAEDLHELRVQSEAANIRYGSKLRTYEVVSYFAVGFITCLEWHARSRKVDLMRFKPSAIETSDVKFIEKNALSQMMAANVTVPYLVGAATHVASIADYVEVFERIFKALDISSKPGTLLRNVEAEVRPVEPEASVKIFDVMDNLFQVRNHLVHEIDLAVVGHFSIRDMWDASDAIRFGRAVVTCIKTVEAELMQHAPGDFPNRIDATGYPENEVYKVRGEIARLEGELSNVFNGDTAYGEEGWAEALEASQASSGKEIDFIRSAQFLRPVRHLDRREAIELEYLKVRLAYLSLLKSELPS
jgi:hypothetical protein